MALTSTEEALVRQLLDQQAAILSLAGNEATITSKLGATKVTLSDLVSASAVADADLFLLRQGTTDKSVTGAIVKALATQPDASETVKGIVELATVAEAQAGTDTVRAVTPAGLAASAPPQIQSVAASVAANALTLTLNPTQITFRHPTLTNGTVNKRTVSAAISLVVSSGSTLGTVNNQPARLALIAIDNAGTVELGVVNLSGGNNLDETTLITTVAEGGAGAADSANVIYSATARANVPFRVVGFVDITEATAGTWATAPTTVQGYGGQALAALSSLGYGQTWQNVTRTSGTTYYNTTGRPILLMATVSVGSYSYLYVNGLFIGDISAGTNTAVPVTILIPPGASYSITDGAGSRLHTAELR